MSVSREIEKLNKFIHLLKQWNKAINLVAVNDIDCLNERHINDSKRLIKCLPSTEPLIVDVGSGAGFPGIVLAIYGYKVCMVEKDRRKAIFLKEIVRELGLEADVFNCSIADYAGPSPDIVVARALGSLSLLVKILDNFGPNVTGLFLKGKNYLEELKVLDLAKYNFKVFLDETSQGAIIKIRKNKL